MRAKFAIGTVSTRHRFRLSHASRDWKVVASLNVPRRLKAAFAFALGLGALTFSAPLLAEQPRVSAQPTVGSPQPTAEAVLHPPVLHALGLMSAMRLTEAYLWPEPFAVTDRQRIGLHYQEAYSRPPLWDSHRPLFQADGDRWQIMCLDMACSEASCTCVRALAGCRPGRRSCSRVWRAPPGNTVSKRTVCDPAGSTSSTRRLRGSCSVKRAFKFGARQGAYRLALSARCCRRWSTRSGIWSARWAARAKAGYRSVLNICQ